MSSEALREIVNRLNTSATVLAALGAALDARAGAALDPRIEPHVHDLLRAAGASEALDRVSVAELKPVLAEIRSLMLHHVKLLFDDTRGLGWAHPEAAILQATGDISCSFAVTLKERIAPRLDGLAQRLESADARFIDIGVGVAALAIEMTRQWPSLRVVGIDPWAPSLALARKNVERAGLASRIELREQAGEDLADEGVFDLAWIASAFIPPHVVAAVVEHAARALRPGGWLLLANANPGTEPTTAALVQLRVAQFGGSLIAPAEAETQLARAGLVDVRRLPSPPTSVVSMIAGRRPLVIPAMQAQLDQISKQVPAPVNHRIEAAIEAIEAAGTAPGLSVGDQAPDFTLPDALGRPVSLRGRLVAGPAVLVFYRGEWCPFCNVHLRALQKALPEIKATGASLLAISPQAPDHALSITDKAGLAFDVLSDAGQEVIKAYKLQFTAPDDLQDLIVSVFQTDLRHHTADRSWRLPVPATFVVDRTGVVRAAHVSADFRTRMEPAAIIAALAEIQ